MVNDEALGNSQPSTVQILAESRCKFGLNLGPPSQEETDPASPANDVIAEWRNSEAEDPAC